MGWDEGDGLPFSSAKCVHLISEYVIVVHAFGTGSGWVEGKVGGVEGGGGVNTSRL